MVLQYLQNGKYHIDQNKGLSNNTALSLFEDLDKNLWIGLDNGINCINLQSPVRSYSDNAGVLGTIYSSIFYNNKLYFGTNQGLFCKNINSGNVSHTIDISMYNSGTYFLKVNSISGSDNVIFVKE